MTNGGPRLRGGIFYCASNAPVPRRRRIQGHPPKTTMDSTSYSTRVKAPARTTLTSWRTRLNDTLVAGKPLAHPKPLRALMTASGQTSSGEARSSTVHLKSHKLDLRRSARFATWNVLTLSRTGYKEAVTRELGRLGIDIACLTETRIEGSGHQLIEGYTFIHSGGTQHYRGVALVVASRIAGGLISWRALSDRLLSARFSHHHGHLTVIAAYGPTEVASDAEKDEFYESLAALTASVAPHDQLIIAGDLNAVSGTDRAGIDAVVGPYGSGVPNNNTTRLLDFCAVAGTSIVGSWYRRRDIRRWTWISNDGVTKKEIDHILTRNRKDFVSYRVYRGAECPANTDHRLVIARLRVNIVSINPRNGLETVGRINVDMLRDNTNLQSRYAAGVRDALGPPSNLPDDVEKCWTKVRDSVAGQALVIIGRKRTSRKPWLSDETYQLIVEKRKAVERGDKPARNFLKHQFRKRALEDKERYYNDVADRAELSLRKHDLKSVYKHIKDICGGAESSPSHPLVKADGTPCGSDEEVLDRWKEYYENALNHPTAQPHAGIDFLGARTSEDTSVRSDAPTLEEVLAAVGKLKNGRSAGADGITAELLKTSKGSVCPALHHLFCRVWVTGRVPADWRDGIIISLYKGKGAHTDCSSHRPITLLSVPGKVFAHVLLARIQPLLLQERRPQQSGFTPGRSTSDAVLALRLLSELHREFNRPLYVAYVDLKSAFDSVDREALWKTIRGIGTPDILLNLIKDLHRGTHSRVRVGARLSSSFSTGSGVRQGCVLAPALFCRAVDWVMQESLSCSGITVSGEHFTDADYADDIVAMDVDPMALASTLERMEESCSALGLHVSWLKTKVQNIGSGPPASDLSVLGHTVSGVERFTYLGSEINSVSGSRSEQQRRIGIASGTMRRLSRIWRQRQLSLSTKLRLYTTLVLPVLLYASETWTMTKLDLAHLQAFHMRSQRCILSVRWQDHVTNAAVHARTGLPHIGDVIQARRHSLFGHVVRLPPSVPSNAALRLCRDISMNRRIPGGWRRPRGRPCATWISQFKKDTGVPIATSWSRAEDRQTWRVDATALSGYLIH